MADTRPWWHGAVFYQVDVRSFADYDGDAIGDLDGLRSRLGYLELLGVDSLTLRGADLGSELDSFELLLDEAHTAGIRLTIDNITEPNTLRYWLDRGVDGFHVESADDTASAEVDEYPDRVLIGGNRLPLGGNLAEAGFDADAVGDIIADGLLIPGLPPAWSLGVPHARGSADEFSTAYARSIALVELALPGAVCIQHGEELGLPGGNRTPMPWEGDTRPFGFSSATGSWAAIPEHWVDRTVEVQLEDPQSTLSLYRQALELRKSHPAFTGDEVEWFGAPEGCFAFRRAGSGLICALNSSPNPVPLPPGEILLSSGPPNTQTHGELPEYTAAWLADQG